MRDTFILIGIAIVGLAVAGAFLLFGLGQKRAVAPTTPARSDVSLQTPPKVLAQGTTAPIDTRVNYLIQSNNKLHQLWSLIYGTTAPAIPTVNFSKYDVAAVFAGVQPTTGYSISVFGVKTTPKKEVAVITITRPGPACAVTKKHTSPYAIVLIPSSPLPLTHTDVIKTNFCK